MFDSLQPHELQHARLPCSSLSPRACSNSCPSSQWCLPTISSFVAPFSSCPQSFPASGYFLMRQLLASGGQSIGASASASVLPKNVKLNLKLLPKKKCLNENNSNLKQYLVLEVGLSLPLLVHLSLPYPYLLPMIIADIVLSHVFICGWVIYVRLDHIILKSTLPDTWEPLSTIHHHPITAWESPAFS